MSTSPLFSENKLDMVWYTTRQDVSGGSIKMAVYSC